MAQEIGIFFNGHEPVFRPFGAGTRCVSGQLFRLPPGFSLGPGGSASRPLDFTTPPLSSGAGNIGPGQSWAFQSWYRDSQAHQGFNVSDALSVSFCP